MNWGDIPDLSPNIAAAILEALRQKDPYTFAHCCRVSRYCRLMAKSAGLNEFEQKVIEYAGLFHDVGKIAVPESVLLKPGRLSEEEDQLMRAHPLKSADIIEKFSHIPFFRSMLPGIKHHHERIDGLGYPDGIEGENIPLFARMILVVDTYDAMTTTRPYRKGLSKEIAYQELELFSGKQFDAALVKVFLDSHPHWGDLSKEIGDDYVAQSFKKAA